MTDRPPTPPLQVWADRAREARNAARVLVLTAQAIAETPSHGNGEHADMVSALYRAELDKAAAVSRYADYADAIVGDLLAHRDHLTFGGVG